MLPWPCGWSHASCSHKVQEKQWIFFLYPGNSYFWQHGLNTAFLYMNLGTTLLNHGIFSVIWALLWKKISECLVFKSRFLTLTENLETGLLVGRYNFLFFQRRQVIKIISGLGHNLSMMLVSVVWGGLAILAHDPCGAREPSPGGILSVWFWSLLLLELWQWGCSLNVCGFKLHLKAGYSCLSPKFLLQNCFNASFA